MCCAISAVTEREIVSNNVEEYIPELFKYKPPIEKRFGPCWFATDNKKTRIEVLDNTIKDIKNK